MFAIKSVKDAKFVAKFQAAMILSNSYHEDGNPFFTVVHIPVYAHPSENKEIVKAYITHPNITAMQCAQVGMHPTDTVNTSEIVINRTYPVKLTKSGQITALPFLIPTKMLCSAHDLFVSFVTRRSNNLEVALDRHYQDVFENCVDTTYAQDTIKLFSDGLRPSYRDLIQGFAAAYFDSNMQTKPYSADATQMKWPRSRAWKKFIKAL